MFPHDYASNIHRKSARSSLIQYKMSDRSNKRNKGNRLLPAVLDYNGTVTPNRIYASIPRSQDIDEGFRDLTCRDVLHAVDAFAWWLTDRYGRSESFETIGYVGLNDLRYPMFFYAAMKAGYKVSDLASSSDEHFSSPSNSNLYFAI